ncbi:hypothetical protein BCR37DRAFT_393489 [Protomyces lactucae-debilis]|uniref:Beta-lactamase-like protein n=1 Tax=Protomyces lactucae-debilis TaxID=2754530 RepID=A0A1Y2FBL0_PROLT|nr:uncharacterized protein BCR37DRAFT_393489 [Protomyces lactucae-debilis]ORY80834.1 hypothetical protein BCR37DRAFT_393489 [Protomyces lactucae-debilis]
MHMFPRQVRPIFDVIRLTSGQKSSKDRSASSSRKSGRTSKLSRRAQDAEQGSTTMTKAKTAASQAKKARKSAKKAKKAAAPLLVQHIQQSSLRFTVDAVAIQDSDPALGFVFSGADFVEITQQTSSTLMAAFCNANAERRATLSALKAGHAISLPTGSTLSDTLVSVRERAANRGHSKPGVAGALASACQAKILVLTHFSSRYGGKGQQARHCMRLCEQIAQQASSATQETLELLFADDSQRKGPAAVSHSAKQRNGAMAFYGYKGKVIAASDGIMLDIPRPRVLR